MHQNGSMGTAHPELAPAVFTNYQMLC